MKALVREKTLRAWTAAELATLAALRARGLSIAQCAVRLGRSKGATKHAVGLLKTSDTPKASRGPYYPRKPAQIIGPLAHINPDAVAERVIRALSDLGALMLIQERGQLVGVVPGSRPAQRAEARGAAAIVGTYWIDGASRQAIAEDIRAAGGGAA
jgi:hypothetical protein